ncbi:MAG TPA: hypothetical protein VK325_10125 [Pseudoxanthomonas sp.]|nr:hypothetical protein [Pseudoxanthomonas sp.]
MRFGISLQALCAALAAAGLGLLIWLGISVALLQGGGSDMVLLRSMQRTGVIVAMTLAVSAALLLRHAGAGRWRPLAAAALGIALAAAGAMLVLLRGQAPDPGWLAVASTVAFLSAVAAVLGLGLTLAARGRDGWRPQMVTPNLLAYALLSGAALLFALIAWKWPGGSELAVPAPSLIMLLLVTAALKLLYWFENGGLHARIGDLDPRDTLRRRALVLAVLVLAPLALAAVLVLWPQSLPRLGWGLIAALILAGGTLEQSLLAREGGWSPQGAI